MFKILKRIKFIIKLKKKKHHYKSKIVEDYIEYLIKNNIQNYLYESHIEQKKYIDNNYQIINIKTLKTLTYESFINELLNNYTHTGCADRPAQFCIDCSLCRIDYAYINHQDKYKFYKIK